MSKLKVAIALGASLLGLSLLGDAKKASTSPAPTLLPAAPKLPSIKPKRKVRSDKPLTPMTKEQAAAALAQVWPLIESNRATPDQMYEALEWAQQIGDAEKVAALEARFGG